MAIRVAYVGDSPFINSGFGVVARSILDGLPLSEYEIHCLGIMHTFVPKSIEPFESFQPVCRHDLMALEATQDFLFRVNPDVAFFIGDPGTLRLRFGGLMGSGKMGILPFVTYFPIEGAPIAPAFVEQAKMVAQPVTYTAWGRDQLRDYGVSVDYVWHGADHAKFREYSAAKRRTLRRLVGWHGKFVIGMIGVNKRSNRQPAMIEAARILKDRGRRDFVIYLHCRTSGPGIREMGGWELEWIPEQFGVSDFVVFKPNQAEDHWLGRPSETDDQMLNIPMNDEQAMANLSRLSFIDTINLFDMYMDPASAHGFNLPLMEAARCGVPGATVDDGFARTEVFGDVCHMMEPSAHDNWHTGAHLPLVSPARIADTIEKFMDDSEYRDSIATCSQEKFDAAKWQDAADFFDQKLKTAHEFGQEIQRQI